MMMLPATTVARTMTRCDESKKSAPTNEELDVDDRLPSSISPARGTLESANRSLKIRAAAAEQLTAMVRSATANRSGVPRSRTVTTSL